MIPTDLASFLELIRLHGNAVYSLILAYATSHSLLLALFGGYAAHAGALRLDRLIMMCWLGSFLGDAVRFWIARRIGIGWLDGFASVAKLVRGAAVLAERHWIGMILFHRYPHGIRGVAGFAYGLSNLGWMPFMIMNFLAAGIWSVAIVSIGYAFGHVSEQVVKDASAWVGLVLLVGFLGVSWLLSKRIEQAVQQRT